MGFGLHKVSLSGAGPEGQREDLDGVGGQARLPAHGQPEEPQLAGQRLGTGDRGRTLTHHRQLGGFFLVRNTDCAHTSVLSPWTGQSDGGA